MHVLVVDDNPLMRELTQRFLEHLGYPVQTAETAAQALALAQAEAPALAIVDVRLPDFDGPTLLGQLRALPGCAALPAIAMSGADEVDLRRLVGGQLDERTALMTKPLELDTLHMLVMRQIGPPPQP
jgi:two-component system, cell cycle response regulator DivK